MRVLFNIYPEQSQQRLEQTHLLILALLNFDHTIHIVFHGGSEHIIQNNSSLNKKWQALPLYGAHDFLFLNGPLENLNRQKYHRLCQQAEFIA
jgi:hypothetical protein